MPKSLPATMKALAALSLACFLSFVPQSSALESNKEMETITRLASTIISKQHYLRHGLDDELSSKLFDEYFKELDPSKFFFTKKDIDSFGADRTKLDEQLATGKVTFAFDVFNLYLKRLKQYESFAKETVKKGFDFSKDESFEVDRSKAEWAPDDNALNEVWRKKIKNDVLTYMLVDKAEKEDPELSKSEDAHTHPSWNTKTPEERVLKRISLSVQNWKKDEPIEVLDIYLNSFAHVYDPHSSYLSPKLEEDFNMSMTLKLTGIGAVLSSEDGYTKIEEIMPGGPAAKDATLKPGDRIVAVTQEGGEPVDIVDMQLSDVVRMIRGKKGTKVLLTYIDGSKGVNSLPQTVTLTRDEIPLTKSEAKGEIKTLKVPDGKDTKVGVITLPSFYMDFAAAYRGDPDYKSSTRDVAKILKDFKGKNVDGVILDLRSNGGGSLVEAISLTGLFIKDGPVVQVKAVDELEVKGDDDGGSMAYGGPLMVLINRLSASASEIFAGAIKDYNRGVIVGDSRTHGKGSVQSVVELKNFLAFLGAKFPAGSVKFTNCKFYRVNGSSTQIKGVAPDISFPSISDNLDLGEEMLDNPMPWDSIAAVEHSSFDPSMQTLIPLLKNRSRKRVAESKEFKALITDIAIMGKLKDRKSISLNFDKRWNEYLDNRKLQKEQVKLLRLDDDTSPKNGKVSAKDLYLNESLNVMADMIWIKESQPATTQKAELSRQSTKLPSNP